MKKERQLVDIIKIEYLEDGTIWYIKGVDEDGQEVDYLNFEINAHIKEIESLVDGIKKQVYSGYISSIDHETTLNLDEGLLNIGKGLKAIQETLPNMDATITYHDTGLNGKEQADTPKKNAPMVTQAVYWFLKECIENDLMLSEVFERVARLPDPLFTSGEATVPQWVFENEEDFVKAYYNFDEVETYIIKNKEGVDQEPTLAEPSNPFNGTKQEDLNEMKPSKESDTSTDSSKIQLEMSDVNAYPIGDDVAEIALVLEGTYKEPSKVKRLVVEYPVLVTEHNQDTDDTGLPYSISTCDYTPQQLVTLINSTKFVCSKKTADTYDFKSSIQEPSPQNWFQELFYSFSIPTTHSSNIFDNLKKLHAGEVKQVEGIYEIPSKDPDGPTLIAVLPNNGDSSKTPVQVTIDYQAGPVKTTMELLTFTEMKELFELDLGFVYSDDFHSREDIKYYRIYSAKPDYVGLDRHYYSFYYGVEKSTLGDDAMFDLG